MSTTSATPADPTPSGSRRGLIKRGAAAAAGGIGLAAFTADPAHAATGAMVYGDVNEADNLLTTLRSSNSGGALLVENTGAGAGLTASGGYGVDAYGTLAPIRLHPAASAGAPTTGAHTAGEVHVDSLGKQYVCVKGGTPGTWVRPGLNPLTPFRICDTRAGTLTSYSNGVKLGAGGILTIPVVGVKNLIPYGASAIVGNVTVTQPTAYSYLTVYPADVATRPTASTLNFAPNQAIANQVTTRLSAADGALKIFNSVGSTHVILDITGYYY
ncbi:MAG: hypothetical protein HOV79_11570 [Hamadaea sp.]|nr:hypothetical protein [Hamadaea sp.]